MNWMRFWAVGRKEFIHVIRDPQSLITSIAIPMLLLTLFGYALSLDVDRVPMVVWDQSRTPASRDFIDLFKGSRYFSLQNYVDTYSRLERAIDGGTAIVGMVLPTDFSERLGAGRPVSVQLIVDGSDSNTATIAMGYADAIVQSYSLNASVKRVERLGAHVPRPPLDFQPRVWFNEDLQSRNYIVPGLIAVIMMIIAAMLTSLTVAREWERGTMEQLLSTPVRAPELIFGKLVPYFVIGMVDVVLAVLMGQFLFHVPLRGSVLLLFIMAAVFLAGALSLGILISVLMKNQLLASQAAMILTYLPAFLLSGFMFAIGNMPKPLQWLSYLIPARYFITLLKGIYLKGTGIRVLAPEALLLVVFAIVMMVLANVRFKKRLE
ncbi:MAG: ABC transporter permease [Acidobacteriia bacterium]|nr:ABC transporter permease [Terriglobia bacterium]